MNMNFINSYYNKPQSDRFEQMLVECKQEIIRNIVNPFGLGLIVATYDKTGSNVDTIHNVRHGIYATKEEHDRYKNRGDYKDYIYHNKDQVIRNELEKTG